MNNLNSDDMNSSCAVQTAAPNSFAVLLSAAVLLIGATLVFVLCRGPIGILCFIPAGLVVVALASLIFSTVQVADQWNKAVVLRLGKFQALRGPGLFFIIPFIDNIVYWIDTRVLTTAFKAEKTLTNN